jgi:PAS domain S-box-containing protein
LEAGLAVPVMAGEVRLGLLEFLAPAPLAPHPMVVHALEQVAAQLAAMTERVRGRAALQRSNRQQELLLEAAGEGICGIDAAGRITFANPAFARILGWTAREVAGVDHAALFHAGRDLDEATQCPMGRALRDGGRYHVLDDTLHHRDGREVPVEYVCTAIRDGDGIVGGVVVLQDLRERRRQEAALRREATLRDLLAEATLAANQSRTLGEAIDAALAAVGNATGWPVGHAFVLAPGEEALLVSSRRWHLAPHGQGFARFREVTEAIALRIDEGLPGEVLRRRGPVWIEDVQRHANFPRNRHGDLGVRAAMAFPVLVHDQVVAVLEFFHPEALPRDEALLRTLGSVGAQLGRVAEREAAEARIRASEARFRAVADSAHDGIVTADERGRIVYANAAAERMFGHAPGTLQGMPLTELMPAHYREAHAAGLQRFLAGGEGRVVGRSVELSGLRADGEEFPLELSLAAWEEGGQRRFTGILRDVTDRHEAARELERANRELARSNAELEQFAYVASHDLQEPLRMVASYVQLLQRRYQGRLDPDADEFIRYAVEGAQRMQALINALLAYSRVGREGTALGLVDLGEVMRRVLDNLRTAIEEQGAVVTHDPLPVVRGDPNQFGQVLQNLLANALKFRGPHAPRIHVGAERDDVAWTITVEDNGIGIDPRFHDRIFVIFQRLHTRDQYEGTGIGLSLCKKIVERRGGRIGVESIPGEGATFRFTIPHLPSEPEAPQPPAAPEGP